ncbi:MAG: hypothetical protein OQJ89_12350 [Kangiellaceae bacterium]|nr:hypothetical protein [Kangiellaceae bacterium]MCW9017752.1 hypothetical protein [Kangiellaceae bacterium]
MNSQLTQLKSALRLFGVIAIFGSFSAFAGGPVGDHVNHLSDNLDKYTEEVNWLIKKVDGIVVRYEKSGAKEAKADAVVDHWEAVKFHAAIESNYVPVYAAIWQGLFGVKESIDNGKPMAAVRVEQHKLEQALWQALGAVKLAAQFQERGLLTKVALREGGPTNSVEALDQVKMRLDRVVAKFAEKLVKESVDIVHDTYLNLFEGVEGDLIAINADLVEDLEKDFNVTLPKAIQGKKSSVDDVRRVVDLMHGKIDIARALLTEKDKKKKDVF